MGAVAVCDRFSREPVSTRKTCGPKGREAVESAAPVGVSSLEHPRQVAGRPVARSLLLGSARPPSAARRAPRGADIGYSPQGSL